MPGSPLVEFLRSSSRSRVSSSQPQLLVLLAFVLVVLNGCGNAAPLAENASDPPETAPTIIETTAAASPEGAVTPEAAATTPAITPTFAPVPSTATASTPASIDEEVTNDSGGFAFIPPADWDVDTNEGVDGFGGAVALVPTGSDLDTSEVFIFMTASSVDLVLESLDADVSLDDNIIDQLLATYLVDTEGVDVSDQGIIQVGGQDGRLVNITGSDVELGEMAGSVALIQLEDDRLFQMIGIGPLDAWQQNTFDTTIETVRFYEPVEADLPEEFMESLPTPDSQPEALNPEGGEDTSSSSDAETGAASSAESMFPLPESAEDVMPAENENAQVNFQTNLSLEEAIAFYRTEFTQQGAVERTVVTATTDNTFSIVFDGWPAANGRAVVVQGVSLNATTTNVNIRLEDI